MVNKIIVVCFVAIAPAMWFLVQASFWWNLLPWFAAIPLILATQVAGVALFAVVFFRLWDERSA